MKHLMQMVVLTVICLVIATPRCAAAIDSLDQSSRFENEHLVYQYRNIQVESESNLDMRYAKRLVSWYLPAYRFASQYCQLPVRIETDDTINLHVMDEQELRRQSPGAYAFCCGPHDIVVSVQAITGDEERICLTLAHETVHLLHKRAGAHLPSYFEEGIAKSVGQRYLAQYRELTPGGSRYLQNAYKLATEFDSAYAEHVLRDDIVHVDHQRTAEDEVAGQLYVEFLARAMNESCVATISRFNQLIQLTSANVGYRNPQWSTEFDNAFYQAFGFSKASADAQFVRFIAQTQNRPRQRTANTCFENLEPPVGERQIGLFFNNARQRNFVYRSQL